MNQIIMRVLEGSLGFVEFQKVIAENGISYKYKNVECFSVVDPLCHKENYLDYAEAVIRKNVCDLDLLILSNESSGHIDFIRRAIKVKYADMNTEEFNMVMNSHIVDKAMYDIMNFYEKIKQKPSGFLEKYEYCLKHFGKYLERQINSSDMEAQSMQAQIMAIERHLKKNGKSFEEQVTRMALNAAPIKIMPRKDSKCEKATVVSNMCDWFKDRAIM